MNVMDWTRPTSQPERLPLNEWAPRNMPLIHNTFDTFQREMSSLKSFMSLNSASISVTSETSHDAMGPYLAFAAAESLCHATTATRTPASLILYPCKAAAVGAGASGGEANTYGGPRNVLRSAAPLTCSTYTCA